MKHYFNEFDPFAAGWLRELVQEGLLPAGEVDERSIAEVEASDLRDFGSCHFFAGIGGWCRALELAGWPAERSVWTGSCPCQPYSSAGKGKGDKDARNLWPEFFRLIRQCRPDVVFGEQVESAIGFGWLDGISRDLEGEGYAVGSAVLGAGAVGAPHRRHRLFWVASLGMANTARQQERSASEGDARGVEYTASDGRKQRRTESGKRSAIGGCGESEVLGDAQRNGRQARFDGIQRETAQPRSRKGDALDLEPRRGASPRRGVGNAGGTGPLAGSEAAATNGYGSPVVANDFWSESEFVSCRDGKFRRVPTEPALFPLADGIPGRVGQLRGAGNAIVPQVAAEFIRAFLDVEHEQGL